VQKRKKRNNGSSSKDKRREFIGKAKAVDRGQWATVYNPGGKDYHSFEAKSGLPDRTKLFTVLGIESSCDDTGGVFSISKCLSSFLKYKTNLSRWLRHYHINSRRCKE